MNGCESRSFVARVGVCVCAIAANVQAQFPATTRNTEPALVAPVIEGRWLRPADTAQPAIAEWGHADGLRVGLAQVHGPRGLLRIYAPYLDQTEPQVINFLAVEPTPAGQRERGYSELERSALDGMRGKRFWSTDTAVEGLAPLPTDRPARGVIQMVDGVEQLSAFVQVEPFDNGASVSLRLRFRADRPHEVGVAVFTRPESKPLKQCVITATMGNFARLRKLELADRTIHPKELWPSHTGDGFTPQATFPLSEMRRDPNGDANVVATPDEADPTAARYADGTSRHWHYTGLTARQSWRMASPPAQLVAQVNGRFTYWASRSPIPGGVAFENLELAAPFEQGQEFWFGVEPLTAKDRPTTLPLHTDH